ncbi:chromate efflux transporter [Paenibacillus apiarius]|uniref:chromate efflux transporter n=1 Tax=Paenibacillus apiarius TaxID=46240 RepID=UPI003B3A1B68
MEVLGVSTKLGLTSFGGPIAHLGYFHDEYIRRRKWMDERSYADLVALCEFLPGPASSQVGIGLGVIRAGLLGGLIAWLGFTLPSVIALVLFAFHLKGCDMRGAGWIHGLKIVAVAIVAHAILGMGQKLTPDRNRVTIAIIAASVTLLWQTAFGQVLLIVTAGIILDVPENGNSGSSQLASPYKPWVCCHLYGSLFGLLITLPLIRQFFAGVWLPLFDSFYRAGSLVFGGGHIVTRFHKI